MTVYINTGDRYIDEHCVTLFNYCGYAFNSDKPDIIITNFDYWKTIKSKLSSDILVSVVSLTEFGRNKLPPEILFYVKPIDINLMVDEIIEIHRQILKNKKEGILY